MLFVKGVRAIQLSFELWITVGKGAAGSSANGVARLITDDRGKRGKQQQPRNVQLTGGGKYSGSDQERITGKEESEKQAGFYENNSSNSNNSAPLDQLANIQ
jgi:hypothetical protein